MNSSLNLMFGFRPFKPQSGTNGVSIPCDPEREAEGIRSQDGIPLVMPVVEDLPDISQTTGIAYDQFISDALFSL
jgi:LDH2 family malate/lactate/ureidoglycolate dehydrogenase